MNGQQVVVKGTGSYTQVLPANPRRQSLVLSSNSTSICMYAFGGTAPANGGLTLNVQAGCLVLTRKELGDYITQPLWGSTGATAYLTVLEGFE